MSVNATVMTDMTMPILTTTTILILRLRYLCSICHFENKPLIAWRATLSNCQWNYALAAVLSRTPRAPCHNTWCLRARNHGRHFPHWRGFKCNKRLWVPLIMSSFLKTEAAPGNCPCSKISKQACCSTASSAPA